MVITFCKESGIFDLNTAHTTYQIKIGPCGLLTHTYYGPSAAGDMSYCFNFRDRGFSGNPYDAGLDRTISADTLPMEYPCEGSGDYRATAFGLRRENGASGCDLRYKSHEILSGKYSLPGLPAVYAEGGNEAETLIITLSDENAGVEAELFYGVFPERDVITRAARIKNVGDAPVTIENAASAALDMLSGDWDLINFHGRHAGERAPERVQIGHQELLIGSRRGTSSHHQNPFVILADSETTESFGLCCGVSLLYSGSFACSVGRDQCGTTRLVMGVQPERFSYRLEPGESFQAPEAAIALTTGGLSALSHIFHDLIRERVCRGPWRDKRRPVLINNWEATGMSFDRELILKIARQAAELGVEMMVLDDGWFGARNDDHAGLGDWVTNEAKLAGTMGELAADIRAMGMRFGLWIEPEMVNENSDLYRAHPDWALKIPGKPPIRARDQLVLDFSRAEVVDAVFDQIAAVLDECRADYVKMDMNRSLCDVYTAVEGVQSQGAVLYKYVLGVYRFMDKLLERYPELLLEGCSGGGGRFDAGMLYYCPQIWCSDNTDAIDRIRIQYGTSFGYPVSTVGAHVSAVPNYGTFRVTPIDTRAVVAMSGTFGYELDLNKLTDDEKRAVTRQIADFKKYWSLITEGQYYRLTDVMKNRSEAAWMTVSRDGGEALLNIVTLDATGNAPNRFIRLRGLDAGAVYVDEKTDAAYPAAALMAQGFPMPKVHIPGIPCEFDPGEYQSFQIHLVRR